MKKKIPKFDMKKWEEKQDVLAKQANSGGFPPINHSFVDQMVERMKKKLDDDVYTSIGIDPASGATRGTAITSNSNKVGKTAQYKTNPIFTVPVSGTYSMPDGTTVTLPKGATVGNPFDQYLFGGAVDTTDTWGWTPYVTFDPAAGIQAPACCQRDDFINVGFHHDKFVCKVCNKEKS